MPSGRVQYLDGIRALAVLFVVGFHYLTGSGSWRGGYIGVDVFFVLSGFIITQILVAEQPTFVAFVRGRARRLYPPLLAMILVTTAAELSLGTRSGGAVLGSGGLAVIQLSWLPRMFDREVGWIGITWSLGVEWVFYLVWPLLLRIVTGLRSQIAALTCASLALVSWAVSLLGSPAEFYFSPLSRQGELLAGAAAAFIARSGLRRRARDDRSERVSMLGPLALAGLVAWAVWGGDELSSSYRLCFPLLTLAAVALLLAPGALRPLLSSPALSGLGRASYSVYLWHLLPLYVIVQHRSGRAGRSATDPLSPLEIVLGLACAAVLAGLGYRLVERRRRRSESHVIISAPGP